jgi:cold shock CspA family protein
VAKPFYIVPRPVQPQLRPLGVSVRPGGVPARGEVARLLVGQGHGYIRLADGRDVFFHRGDLRDGASFNDFSVGDAVAFGLLEDRISGPRATDVRLVRARR